MIKLKLSALLTIIFFLSFFAQAETGAHFFSEGGEPLLQYETKYQEMLKFYPTSMPEKILVVFTDKDVSKFNTRTNTIYLSRNRFAKMSTYLIAHETSHLALWKYTAGASLDGKFRFFDEGYACIVGNILANRLEEYKHEEALPISATQYKKQNVSFEKVADWKNYFGNPNTADWNFYAYHVGASFNFFILDTYGQQELNHFFLSVGQTRDLESSFQKVFFKSKVEIEAGWLNYLSKIDLSMAQNPYVLTTAPLNNSKSVSINLSEISVTFNTPMLENVIFTSNRCQELCYNNAKWKDSKTLVVTITGKLKANTSYYLTLGSDKYKRYLVSKTGIDMPTYIWKFTTAPAPMNIDPSQ